MEFLHQLGIDIGLAVAGFFGSIVMIAKKFKKGEKVNKWQIFIQMVVGILTSIYITPVVLLIAKVEGNGAYGIGFVCGYLGLQGIEMLIEKYKPKSEDTEDGTGPEH